MAPRPTGEQALVHLRRRLFRHEVFGGFSMVVSNPPTSMSNHDTLLWARKRGA